MVNWLIKITCLSLLLFVISACSSRGAEEVGCNFSSGAIYSDYDEESSGSDNLFQSLLFGVFNIAIQGAHRSISSDSYDSCVKKDLNTCIDSNGEVKKECTLTN